MSYSSAIRAAGLFAVLGALSGLVCAFTPIVEALNISLGWTRLFSASATVPPLPGVVFGLLLSFLIYRHTSNMFRAASGIITSVVAWIIAVHVAEQFGEVRPGGLAGGALGAALTIAGVALAVPGYRSLWSMAVAVLVGAVCGLLLVFMDSDASPLSMLPLLRRLAGQRGGDDRLWDCEGRNRRAAHHIDAGGRVTGGCLGPDRRSDE